MAKGVDPAKLRADKKAMRRALVRNGLTPADLPEKPDWHVNKENAAARAEHYRVQSLEQDHVCAVCLEPERRTVRGKLLPLGRDHCHTSGDWRGLLCHTCNSGLGCFREDLNLLVRAREYLVSYAGLSVEQCGVWSASERRKFSESDLCEICDQPETVVRLGKRLALSRDHCHATLKRRGLICKRCNTGLGQLRDSLLLLRRSSEYLIKWGRHERMGPVATGANSVASLFNAPPSPDWDTPLKPTGTEIRNRSRFHVPATPSLTPDRTPQPLPIEPGDPKQ